ncbi:MAG: methionyl-tRNA formyltransferase [Deltaproteobacteria bacterium]|nr:methionyl-tRNA formyltransferase [Deltaproteobacteria bacterium]
MKILFAGSPEIALPSLEALVHSSSGGTPSGGAPFGIEVVAVLSQPDRPAGRGQKETSPPVALLAKQRKIPLFQPEKLDEPLFKKLKGLSPDLMIVVAYGKILPKTFLELPPQGCLNLHFSLLPKYRGAAPVQWALIHDESETGVTTVRMTEKLDAGPVLLQRRVPIQQEDTVPILSKRLANIGSELLIETLVALQKGEVVPEPQDEKETTWAPSLKKEDGQIDWSHSAKSLANLIRGTTPWPGAYTFLDKKRLKIQNAGAFDLKKKSAPGSVIAITPAGLDVACGQGMLQLYEVQLEGGKRLPVAEFLKGHPIAIGAKLG